MAEEIKEEVKEVSTETQNKKPENKDHKRAPKKDFKKDRRNNRREQSDMDKVLVSVRRVTKVVKGGRTMRFSAMVVVGDKKGKVGIGSGKGAEVPAAIDKATANAKKNMQKIAYFFINSLIFSSSSTINNFAIITSYCKDTIHCVQITGR